MTGIYLLFVIAVWLLIVIGLTALFTKKLPEKWWRLVVRALVFFALLPLPFIDEIVGRSEFAKLCQERALSVNIDRENARGKTVYYEYIYPRKIIKGQVTNDDLISDFWIPIWQRSVRYLNASGEEIVGYKELHADGGWISRGINFNSSHAPYTFEGFCRPKENIKDLFRSLQITATDRPNIETEATTK